MLTTQYIVFLAQQDLLILLLAVKIIFADLEAGLDFKGGAASAGDFHVRQGVLRMTGKWHLTLMYGRYPCPAAEQGRQPRPTRPLQTVGEWDGLYGMVYCLTGGRCGHRPGRFSM